MLSLKKSHVRVLAYMIYQKWNFWMWPIQHELGFKKRRMIELEVSDNIIFYQSMMTMISQMNIHVSVKVLKLQNSSSDNVKFYM